MSASWPARSSSRSSESTIVHGLIRCACRWARHGAVIAPPQVTKANSPPTTNSRPPAISATLAVVHGFRGLALSMLSALASRATAIRSSAFSSFANSRTLPPRMALSNSTAVQVSGAHLIRIRAFSAWRIVLSNPTCRGQISRRRSKLLPRQLATEGHANSERSRWNFSHARCGSRNPK